MKEVFEALATYKLHVDESLVGVVEKLGEDKLLAPTGAFFPTVLAQLKHIFGSDVNWIKRLAAAFPKSPTLSKSRFAAYDLEALKAQPFGDRAAFFGDIRQIDRDIRAFMAELSEKDLARTITYKNYKGEAETHELWKALLHWFNHGVHHRGTISGQLDSLGVENDYSSLLTRI